MNLKVLERNEVHQIDERIKVLLENRKDLINGMSIESRAYHEIKDRIKKLGFVMSVETVVHGAKYVFEGISYSCSVDSVVRDCREQCKILLAFKESREE